MSWPPWQLYQPIAEVALAAGLPLLVGNLSQAILQEIRRHGLAALDEGFRGKSGLDLPLAEEIAAAMRRKLHEAHCGLLPPSAMGFLVAAQRARDAVLADNLARALGAGRRGRSDPHRRYESRPIGPWGTHLSLPIGTW